jgi:50S ribosomal subunit-associated GTPase HflX
VRSLLAELDLLSKPTLFVLNKTDLCAPEVVEGLAARYNAVPVCALDRETFAPLLLALENALWENAQGANEGNGVSDSDAEWRSCSNA